MSTGEEDRIARSVALEKTYVHDVYDHMSALQFPEHRNITPWPKVKKFINDLEPGSIVCDVGCGNGKYLKVNPSIFKIGSDRCCKLTQIAKDDDNEVILCDNLTLPFRDESFDAVLSIAVIHHFATKERRVGALRELARVLRIGGRLMITVWAMEQKDRKFESQDVLVQWHHPQFCHSPSIEFSTTATATSEEEFLLPCRIARTHVFDDTDSLFSRSSSLRQDGRPVRSRLRLFQSLRSIKTSPSSSSLSSPNETCYSFVKKALQKLSRSSKKEKHNPRTWFTESWAAYGKDDHLPATRYDPEGCEEDSSIQDLPIELRRMEKGDTAHQLDKNTTSQSLSVSHMIQKSRSLNDIISQAQLQSSLVVEPLPITRSRSSLVTIDGQKIKIKTADPQRIEAVVDTLKPKLVKQKKSICEETLDPDEDEERDKATDMKKLIKELPMFSISLEKPERNTANVLKQKSLTEEIMSADRLKERENVRQNIQKQASLNEDLIYRRQKALDSLKDTFLVSSSKKFQMFRSGLTSKLKSSTTNIEKVTGASIKSGFAKIFQGLTGGDTILESDMAQQPPASHHSLRKSSSEDRGDEYMIERRCSHEENSDSSKDNSLQSDTSIDSEDSIISVIERVIPKAENATSANSVLTSPGPHSPKMALTGVLSHPSSPKISQIMQYPSTKGKALSLPASPRTLVLSPNIKQTFKIPPVAQMSSNGNGHVTIPQNGGNNGVASVLPPFLRETNGSSSAKYSSAENEPIVKLSSMKQVTAARLKSFSDKEMLLLTQKLTKLNAKETEPRAVDICEGNDDSYKLDAESSALSKDRIKKADQATHGKDAARKSPMLSGKRSGAHSAGSSHQKSLQSFELFNPETEDIDTDSSGVSTPDSVGSVISVKMESSTNGTPPTETTHDLSVDGLPYVEESQSQECSISSLSTSQARSHQITPKESASNSRQGSQEKRDSQSYRLSKSRSDSNESTDNRALKKYPSLSKSPENETWDRECRQYIVDLAENLSERLLAEIDRYKERNISIERELSTYSDTNEDPYLTKLSEDLSHVSKLTKELSADLDTKTTDTGTESADAESNLTSVSNDRRKSITTGRDLFDVEEKEESLLSPDPTCKEEKKVTSLASSDQSTEAESPGSISGWLDSRRNTIESGYWRDRENSEERARSSAISRHQECVRKLSTSEPHSHARLSAESTDTIDVSERTASSSEDSTSKRDTTQTETSSGFSAESDFYDVDKSADTSKSSTEYSGSGPTGLIRNSSVRQDSGIKYSSSQTSLLRPGESVESSDTGDISDRTGSVSDFSRQNTESRSVITQSSASLASWSDCSKDIRFADRRTARCDGRSSSEETNPRAVLTRQVAATEAPSEVKMTSTDTSLSNSTSQDSLTSESAGGGSIMFHRYYHVFREGELDELIEEFVENLHIISSYYDHTNWCIVAEKVHVWTI